MSLRLLLAASLAWFAALAGAAPSIALYYGADPPWDELRAFDIVVVEPDHGADPRARSTPRSELFAYVSLGEAQPSRAYARAIPAEWRIGENAAWGSIVIDQAQPAWPAFFAERVVGPLWARGFRGLFVDTLDSYQLAAKTPEARARQEAGMIAAIREVRRRYPGIRLVFNRGFEILPELRGEVMAVAAESLYRGWNAARRAYREVPEADREWLLGQLGRVKHEYGLPVLAIDYVAPRERALARDTAARIAAHGFVPWVTNPELSMLGVGELEVMPRKVLMLYSGPRNEFDLAYHPIHRFAALPLNHLGYVPEYVNLAKGLPQGVLAGRYAGIVTWIEPGTEGVPAGYRDWLARQAADGVRIAVFQSFGFAPSAAGSLGIEIGAAGGTPAFVRVGAQSPLIGYEIEVFPDRRAYQPLTVRGAEPLLTIVPDRGAPMHAAAFTPWGGYALAPYALATLPGGESQRWVIDPLEFLRRALALPAMPVPDVTTENGRRLLLAHVDGDGFPSRAETAGTPFAGDVLLREVLRRYRIPTTVSVIQAEISPQGLHASQSPALERIARDIFALPHVEIASHSYSHPFRWRKAAQSEAGGYTLALPGYRFDPHTEVGGSLAYINERLAPPGKQARVFLWTGDCNPDEESVGLAHAAGVANLNGGDTTITRAEPTLTRVAPLGIPKGRYFQVYAPNQNENVYTRDWRGPYYGFERAIETFELTGGTRRLKPVNIYYHTYSASKAASLAALHKVYQWALAQPFMAVPASEYAARVLDFNGMVIARRDAEFVVRGAGQLRQLRAPAALGRPDVAASRGVAGHADHGGERYIHLAGDEARIVFEARVPGGPYLEAANARITRFEHRAGSLELVLSGHQPVEAVFGNAAGCDVTDDGRPVAAERAADGRLRVKLHGHVSGNLRVACRA